MPSDFLVSNGHRHDPCNHYCQAADVVPRNFAGSPGQVERNRCCAVSITTTPGHWKCRHKLVRQELRDLQDGSRPKPNLVRAIGTNLAGSKSNLDHSPDGPDGNSPPQFRRPSQTSPGESPPSRPTGPAEASLDQSQSTRLGGLSGYTGCRSKTSAIHRVRGGKLPKYRGVFW